MTMTKATTKTDPLAQPGRLVATVREYLSVDGQVKTFTRRKDQIKARFKGFLEQVGEEDEKGSLWIELGEEVDGVNALKNERRVYTVADTDAAEALLAKKGLDQSAGFDMVPTLNEDKIAALLWEGKITRKEFDRIFKQQENFALRLVFVE